MANLTGSNSHFRRLAASVVCVSLVAGGSVHAQATVYWLGNLVDFPQQPSFPTDMSADGAVVVGGAWTPEGHQAFRWTLETGMVGLGDLPGGGLDSWAAGTSADGSVVVGVAKSALGHEAFVWTAEKGMVALGDLPGGGFKSNAAGISDDGRVIVGTASTEAGSEAFIWTAESGMVGLGDLPGGAQSSYAGAMDSTGSWVLGESSSDKGDEPFIWTEQTGMVGLGLFPGEQYSVAPYDLSDGGGVVVGFLGSDGSPWVKGFRWTLANGYELLTDLPGGETDSSARAVSGDGELIGGRAWNEFGTRAALWKEPAEPLDFEGLLVTEYQLDTSEWTFVDIFAMSDDGRSFTGLGDFTGEPHFGLVAWVVHLDSACIGDCTQDGALDFFDFLCFVNAFNTSEPYADCTADGGFDLFDFLCFVNAFNQGC